jgi:hypothetical protein
MSLKQHLQLFIYSFLTWFTFYLIGLPDYYQSWLFELKVVICVLVTWMYFPITRFTLKKYWQDGQHLRNACWLALYLTLPFFIYDYLLLGLYFELGIGFVKPYWYLTFFYFSFWLQFPYIGWRMQQQRNV